MLFAIFIINAILFTQNLHKIILVKSSVHNYKQEELNCEVAPSRNKINLLDLTFSFSDDLSSAIIEAFMSLLIRSSVEAEMRAFQLNERA